MNNLEIIDNLKNVMRLGGVKYELQYQDYDSSTWTVPVLLTDERIEKIKEDNSIKNIRLIIPFYL